MSPSNPCTYPEDARKAGRLSKAEIETLQHEILIHRRLFKDREVTVQVGVQQPEPLGQTLPETAPSDRDIRDHSFSQTSSPPQVLSFN
jgi:hypothetical protein